MLTSHTCIVLVERCTSQYNKASNEAIADFVHKYITCKKDQPSEVLNELVNLQMHRHAKTYKKQGHKICRFNFPLPPLPSIMKLEPLQENSLEEDEIKELKLKYDKIKCLLDEMKCGADTTFNAFLEKLKLTKEHTYKPSDIH